MAKSPTYNKKAVDKQLTKNGVRKPKVKALTHNLLKGHQKTDEGRVDEISSDMASRYKKRAKMDRDFNDDDLDRAVRKSRYGSDDDAAQASADMTRLQRRNSKRTAGINRANKRIGEAAAEAGLDDNKPIIVKGVKGMKSTAFTKKFRNMAAYDKWTDSDAFGDYDVQQIMNEGAPATLSAAMKRNQAAKERNVRRAKAMMKKGFSAEQAAKEHDLKPSDLKESKMNKTKINEGVLDDVDDDGFMAKRQLYDLAKYSVELHRMIQDTDNLEPWVQAKITKAADYIDTVKHYLEYQGVRDSEEATVDFGMDDIADVEDTLDTMGPEQPMEEVMEFEDESGDRLYPEDVLRMALTRGIVSQETYEFAFGGGDNGIAAAEMWRAAEYVADGFEPGGELGSSDISILMREFVSLCNEDGNELDGPRAHLYESANKAQAIYKKMLGGLKGKK